MLIMTEIGMRALRQNPAPLLARIHQGEQVTITERGRPVATVNPISSTPLQRLYSAGLIRPALRQLGDLSAPSARAPLSEALSQDRSDERF